MKITIVQKPEKGILSGPHQVVFSTIYKGAQYKINIEQSAVRKITIETLHSNYQDILYVFYSLEDLLFLFDGRFYPTIEANDGADITVSWNERTLPSRHSADFMMNTNNKLVDWETVLDNSIFDRWLEIKKNIDLVHKMVLYCLSSVGMPKDMQCAFMIEAYKGLCDLIHKYRDTFAPELFINKEIYLKTAFLAVADKYGNDIFSKEFSQSKDKFAQVLINTRNRIAHISDWNGTRVLTKDTNVWYIIKLSLLYRVVMYDLMDISPNTYNIALKSYITIIDGYPAVKRFINSIPRNQTGTQNPELVNDIYSLLYSFVYSTAVYRVIHSRRQYIQNLTEEQSQYWCSVSDNSIQMAVVDWCKVFGSYDERTHYKNINTDYIQKFEEAIIVGKGIDLVEYTKSMKTFRDKYIAHKDKKKKRKPIPYLDKALEISYLYERMVICGDPGVIPFDLELFYISSIGEINKYFDSIGVLRR